MCIKNPTKVTKQKPIDFLLVKKKLPPNLETHVEIRESVRSKDVFIIQTGSTKYVRKIHCDHSDSFILLLLILFFLSSCRDPNDNLMELMIMSYACKTSCARNIIVRSHLSCEFNFPIVTLMSFSRAFYLIYLVSCS